MDIQVAFIIVVVLIVIVSFVTYKLGKRVSGKFLKYIPVITIAFGIGIFFIKMRFISNGYDKIIDMIIIILLATIFFISIIVSAIIEIMNRRKK